LLHLAAIRLGERARFEITK